MKMNKSCKLLSLGLGVLCLGSQTGCVDSLLFNVWTGFGLAIGGVPGNLIANIIANAVGVAT